VNPSKTQVRLELETDGFEHQSLRLGPVAGLARLDDLDARVIPGPRVEASLEEAEVRVFEVDCRTQRIAVAETQNPKDGIWFGKRVFLVSEAIVVEPALDLTRIELSRRDVVCSVAEGEDIVFCVAAEARGHSRCRAEESDSALDDGQHETHDQTGDHEPVEEPTRAALARAVRVSSLHHAPILPSASGVIPAGDQAGKVYRESVASPTRRK
jgi:hypothetical protein